MMERMSVSRKTGILTISFLSGRLLHRAACSLPMPVPINYLAVIVAAAAAVILGFLWYGPFFGNAWMKLMGFTKEDMTKAMKNGMAKTYGLMIVGALLMAAVLTYVVTYASAYTQTSGLSVGLQSGFWIWLGFAVPLLMDGQLWEGKSWKLFWINASYRLVSLLLMGAILASWM